MKTKFSASVIHLLDEDDKSAIVSIVMTGLPDGAAHKDVLMNAAHAVIHKASKLHEGLDLEKAKAASETARYFVLRELAETISGDLADLRKLVEAQQIMTSADFADALKQAMQYDGL